MGILVVGSVALDSVKTPFGTREDVLGGAATYFSIAASYFTDVSMIAVVGEDFPEKHVASLQKKGIDLSGLERRQGKTFRWKGEYAPDFSSRTTLDTQLNVFADFSPKLTLRIFPVSTFSSQTSIPTFSDRCWNRSGSPGWWPAIP